MNPTQRPPENCPTCKSRRLVALSTRPEKPPYRWIHRSYECQDCGWIDVPRPKTDAEYARWRTIRIKRLTTRYAKKQPDWDQPDTQKRAEFLLNPLIPTGGRVVEIGVRYGVFSEMLLHHLEPTTLHLIDPWTNDGTDPGSQREEILEAQYQGILKRFKNHSPQVNVLRMKSARAADMFHGETLDMVYIDGNHLYEFVLCDCMKWWPKLKPGGVLAGHDYRLRSEFRTAQWDVKEAVDNFGSLIHQKPRILVPGGSDWMFQRPLPELVIDG